MNAGERRRLYARAGILMVTKGMDPARAILEAARQLGITGGHRTYRDPARRAGDPGIEKGRP